MEVWINLKRKKIITYNVKKIESTKYIWILQIKIRSKTYFYFQNKKRDSASTSLELPWDRGAQPVDHSLPVDSEGIAGRSWAIIIYFITIIDVILFF